jgi:HEPN domain-containing protein
MNEKEEIAYWKKMAKHDAASAKRNFRPGDYQWCLFLWHLSLEKLLKAILLQQGKEPIKSHNLVFLAKRVGISLTDSAETELEVITGFNLEARYDEYKKEFYKRATAAYTARWKSTCQKWYNELEKML